MVRRASVDDKERLVFYCRTTSASNRTTSASTAPCTSRRMCYPTHCASYCAPCQPLLRACSAPRTPRRVSRAKDPRSPKLSLYGLLRLPAREGELFIDNLLVRIHFIIVMIRWTGLAPWESALPAPLACQKRGHQASVDQSISGNKMVAGFSGTNPKPLNLNPQPSTLNPQPSTLNPKSQTLNPKPEPLNPEP